MQTEPDFDSRYDVLTFDLDDGFAGLDLRPEIIETTGSDEWDAGINYANTSGADWCFNDTIIHGTVPKDSVSGGGKDRKGRMLDNVIRRDCEITPETGLTGPGNVRARKPRVGDGARRLRKQRTRN